MKMPVKSGNASLKTKSSLKTRWFWLVGSIVAFGHVGAHEPHVCPPGFAAEPALEAHMSVDDIIAGLVSFEEVFLQGEDLFVTKFNICDGIGRRASTGCDQTKRDPAGQPDFHRVSGPDTNSCAGCHNFPRAGGAGDINANAFVLAQCSDPVIDSVNIEFSNERNTMGMHGSGIIQRLAEEMTAELREQIDAGLPNGWNTISAKGVSFEVDILAGVLVDAIGLDFTPDLRIRPFAAIGNVAQLEGFTCAALNHHHGMQAELCFDNRVGDPDFDEDGVERELTNGDLTALVTFQAALGTPGQVLPAEGPDRDTIFSGRRSFRMFDCNSCHTSSMTLDDPVYEATAGFSFDLTQAGEWPRPSAQQSGTIKIRAYTDLKIHNLCDAATDPDPIRDYCNEERSNLRRAQLNHEHELRPGSEFFITRKLWDAGSSPSYGHRGNFTTLYEAIMAHGGEARPSRDAYAAATPEQQLAVVKWLKSLQVLEIPGNRARLSLPPP